MHNQCLFNPKQENEGGVGHSLPLLKMTNLIQNHAVYGLGTKKWMLDTDQLDTQNNCASHEQILTRTAQHWLGIDIDMEHDPTRSTLVFGFSMNLREHLPERSHPIPSTFWFVPLESWIIR